MNAPRLRTRGVIALAASLLAACAGMGPEDNARLHREVGAVVQPGAAVGAATRQMAAIGFSCGALPSGAIVECTRSPSNVLLYACIQRVDLALDASRQGVSTIEVQPIACAGM